MPDDKHDFPDCFPPEFAEEILPKGLVSQKMDVYRISTSGIINRDTFLSTYEEVTFKGRRAPRGWEKKLQKKDPGVYSTSCYEDKLDAIHILNCLRIGHPESVLIHGAASSEYGPMQRTSERKPRDDSHVDWWLYKDAYPNDKGQFQIQIIDEELKND